VPGFCLMGTFHPHAIDIFPTLRIVKEKCLTSHPPPCSIPTPQPDLCIFFPAITSDTVGRMEFTEADIQEFIAIWKEEFHETISVEDARRSAVSLMELYAWLIFGEEEMPSM